MMKKGLACLLALLVTLSAVPLSASAAELTLVESAQNRLTDGYFVKSDGTMWDYRGTTFENAKLVRDNVAGVSRHLASLLWIDVSGDLWAEGTNTRWQLGPRREFGADGLEIPLEEPARLLSNVASARVFADYALALTRDGTLWSWGSPDSGQLGYSNVAQQGAPQRVMGNVVQFDAGSSAVVALTRDGGVWTWGGNMGCALGRGVLPGKENALPENNWDAVPTKILDGATWVSMSGTSGGAVKADGSLWTWGDNTYAQLGTGESTFQPAPYPVKVMDGVKRVAMGTAVIKADGTVWTWGNNSYGAVGKGSWNRSYEWVRQPVQIMEGVVEIWSRHAALKGDGTLWAWGHNTGQFGDVMTHGDCVVSPALARADFGVVPPTAQAGVSAWARGGVEQAAGLGLITARTAVGYREKITRLSFTDLIVNFAETAMGAPLSAGEAAASEFYDMSAYPQTVRETVAKAYTAQLVNGVGENAFSPEAPITREQVAAILYRTMVYIEGRTGRSFQLKGNYQLSSHADGAQVSSWAADGVAALAASGIMQGSEGLLSPGNNITVEECILLVLRAYQNLT